MHHQDHRRLAFQGSGNDQIPSPFLVPLGRRERLVLRPDIRIVERNLLGGGIVRQQGRQQHAHREPGRRQRGQPRHERPLVYQTVRIFVIPIKRLLGDGPQRIQVWILVCRHSDLPRSGCTWLCTDGRFPPPARDIGEPYHNFLVRADKILRQGPGVVRQAFPKDGGRFAAFQTKGAHPPHLFRPRTPFNRLAVSRKPGSEASPRRSAERSPLLRTHRARGLRQFDPTLGSCLDAPRSVVTGVPRKRSHHSSRFLGLISCSPRSSSALPSKAAVSYPNTAACMRALPALYSEITFCASPVRRESSPHSCMISGQPSL